MQNERITINNKEYNYDVECERKLWHERTGEKECKGDIERTTVHIEEMWRRAGKRRREEMEEEEEQEEEKE